MTVPAIVFFVKQGTCWDCHVFWILDQKVQNQLMTHLFDRLAEFVVLVKNPFMKGKGKISRMEGFLKI